MPGIIRSPAGFVIIIKGRAVAYALPVEALNFVFNIGRQRVIIYGENTIGGVGVEHYLSKIIYPCTTG